MLYIREENQPLKAFQTFCFVLLLTCLAIPLCATPLPNFSNEEHETTTQNSTDNPANASTDGDVYIIRAVVYEIGVLTDTDNTTDGSKESHEDVDIAFYNPPHKDTGLWS